MERSIREHYQIFTGWNGEDEFFCVGGHNYHEDDVYLATDVLEDRGILDPYNNNINKEKLDEIIRREEFIKTTPRKSFTGWGIQHKKGTMSYVLGKTKYDDFIISKNGEMKLVTEKHLEKFYNLSEEDLDTILGHINQNESN